MVGGLGKLAAIMWKALHSVGPKTRGSVLAVGLSFVAHVPTADEVFGLYSDFSSSMPEGSVQHPSHHWCAAPWLPVQVHSSGVEAKPGVKSKPVVKSS